MRPDPNALPPQEDYEGRTVLKTRRGVPWLYLAYAAFATLPIWIALGDTGVSGEGRFAAAASFGTVAVLCAGEGLRLLFGWAYRLSPESLEIHRWWLSPARRIDAADLLAVARGKGGRARLVIRVGGGEALVRLPLFQLSVGDSRLVVDWVHAHAKDPKTRLLPGATDWSDTTGFSGRIR